MSDLHIFDSKQRKKRRFEPVNSNEVKIYVCGPTVYDRVHIGNGLSAVVFDVFVRLLRSLYPKVKYIRNITDVDDKINKRAAELGVPISVLTSESIQALHEDYTEIGILPPDEEPRATEHIDEIIDMIQCLIDSEHAYEAEKHVLFYVPSDPNYGSLSHRSLDELVDGARVEVAPFKRDAKDFVLWKPSTSDLPGWDSPWGRGRPGWHIECSAMIKRHLGEVIDIHGGGSDLAFPHHENEMAQSTCLQKNDYVRYWMHNGMLNFGSQKMAKSLGNVQTVNELLSQHSGEVLRYALLSGHYRQTLRWDEKLIQQAERSLHSFYNALRRAELICEEAAPLSTEYTDCSKEHIPSEVLEPLLDDVNTPRALAGMHALVSQLNQTNEKAHVDKLRRALLAGGSLLGLLSYNVREYFEGDVSNDEIELIDALVQQRSDAKAERNFSLADSIRQDLLLKHSVVIEDSREGTTWRVDPRLKNKES